MFVAVFRRFAFHVCSGGRPRPVMHDSGIGIDSGISHIFAGIGIGLGINFPGIGTGIGIDSGISHIFAGIGIGLEINFPGI